MNGDYEHRPLIAMISPLLAGIALVMALGVGKLSGILDPLVTRRGVGATFGVMLIITGNFVPKLRLFQPANGAAHSEVLDRFAGWIFVLSGFVVAGIFLLAPAKHLFIAAPLTIFSGFLAVLGRWLIWRGRLLGGLSLLATPGRVVLTTMLATLLWMGAIFLADAFWGDAVSRWMVILFLFFVISFSAFRAKSDSPRN